MKTKPADYSDRNDELVRLRHAEADRLATIEELLQAMADMQTELSDRSYYCENQDDETPWQTVRSQRLEQWDAAIDKAKAVLDRLAAREE